MKKILSAVLVAFAASAPPRAQDAYVVGVSAAMTGPGAGIYAPVVEAMRIYIDHVNAKGGVNGKQVRLVVQDDGAEPSRAAANAKKLLTQDNVVMLINSSLSSTYAPMVAEAKRARRPALFRRLGLSRRRPIRRRTRCSSARAPSAPTSIQQGALAFVKAQAKEPVRIGFAAMAIPIARAEIDYAEDLSKTMGMTPVEKQISPPPAPDYTPFATKLKDANPNWVYSWAPWVAQVRTFEALRRLGWNGRYITWAHLNAEEELARIKDSEFYVIGTNALFQDDLPIQAEIRAADASRQADSIPLTYLTEGFIAGMVIEADAEGDGLAGDAAEAAGLDEQPQGRHCRACAAARSSGPRTTTSAPGSTTASGAGTRPRTRSFACRTGRRSR